MSKSILCIVPDTIRAEMMVGDLKQAGFSSDDISLLLPDKTGTRDFELDVINNSWVRGRMG